MTVKFETIAHTAPTGIAYTVWVSINSPATSGETVHWSDDTGLPGLWQSATTYTGEIHHYLASGTITVPASEAGRVKLTADAGPLGTASHTITFEHWGANPALNGVSTNRALDILPSDPGSGIDYSARVTKTDGTPIAGAEVQWVVQPNNGVPKLFHTSGKPLPSVKGGYWAPVLTDSAGNATVKIVATKTLAVTMTAEAPGVQQSGSATGYFINPDDPSVPTLWQSPYTTLNNGELRIRQGQTQWRLTLPQLSSTWTQPGYSAYLYFQGNLLTVPWTTDDTTSMIDELPIELPTSIVKLSGDLGANQTMLFTQSPTGSVVESATFEFGAYDE
jgi:hypothetical protein